MPTLNRAVLAEAPVEVLPGGRLFQFGSSSAVKYAVLHSGRKERGTAPALNSRAGKARVRAWDGARGAGRQMGCSKAQRARPS